MTDRPHHKIFLLCLFCVTAMLLACDKERPAVAELSGATMGTTFSIRIAPPPTAVTQQRLRLDIERRLREINDLMSTYQADSALMRFNRSSDTNWLAVPMELANLIARAQAISRLSDGRYDITVQPLVELWGFGAAGARSTPPLQDEIEAVLARVGYTQLSVSESPPRLRKNIAGLQIDLSSIAKGWAVDELAKLLETQGQNDFLVEIGGEVRAQGRKADGSPWRVAIQHPADAGLAVHRVVELNDHAMATSGDYRNYFVAGGESYPHTIDPKSGQSIRQDLASVSVIADNCADADAWATALLAMGQHNAPALADRLELEAVFLVRTPNGLREQLSSAFVAARR
jgi:thiamine biosynthesis lipoprotein